jgi:hypothetical protein
MKSSIAFCSEFAKKYKVAVVPMASSVAPVIAVLPELPESKEYSGKRRGRKPGSKKVREYAQNTFRIEEKEVNMEFE